jgi:outer membrane protein assembly factor BamA
VPQRIVWVLSENFGQSAADPLLPATPTNRQNVNVLSTGPDLKMHLGAQTTLTASARYDDVRYEVSPTDYQGWSGQLELGHELSPASSLNLVAGRERVDYQDGVFPNYDRDQAYLQYVVNGSRTMLDAALGWSRIDTNVGSDDKPLARLTVSRQVSPLSTVSLSGQYGLSTGGEIFRSLQPRSPGTLPSQPDASIGDAARQTLVNAAWKTQWQRTTLDIGATFGKEQYANATSRDVDRRGANLGLSHALTPSLDVSLTVNRERRDYTTLGRVFDDTGYDLSAQQKLGRSLSAVLELARNERTDTLNQTGYTENVAFLRLEWARER